MAMAKAGNVTEAIHLALDVYHQASSSYVYRPSNPLDLVSSLCNMTLVCLRSPSLNPQSDISQLIHFCLAISAESFLYLDFYEEIQLHHYTSIFHDVILHLLKSKSLQRLSPSFTTPIFKNLVEAKMWKEFETMLSWMTLPMIDFDICFRVCRKYELHRGCLHLYRLSDQLVEGLTNMLPISSNAPFEFLLELSTLHLLNQKQIQSVMIWAQRHWEEAFILSPSFVLKYTKTLFQWSPPHLRQHLVDSLLEFRSDEFTASKSILIQLMLVHAKKDHPDHLVLSSQDLHGFFITWTHATPAETDLLHLDGFQQGLIYLLETLFYVKDHTVFQRVLQFSREHQLWNVCEYLYLQLNQPVFLLDCLLFDSSRQFRVFHAFPSLLQACPSEQAFWEHVLEVAQALIELSPTEFAMTLHQMNATDWISSIYTKVKDITTSLLPFLDTLTQFSPTLVSQTLFLHCLELNAQQKNDLQCVSLIEMHHLQFLCLDHCVTLCQRYDLKVSLSKVYDLQCNHEAALSLLLQSNQIHRLFEFCRHHEFAWVQVLCHYLNEPSNFLNMDMFTFLNHLPDPYYFVQSLHQIAWSPRLKKYLDHWTYSIRAKEIQQRLLLRIQQREWLTRVHRRQHQTQGIFIPSLQCLLCKNATSSIDVIWYGCGHGFHQHCLKTYYNSPQPDTWTECVKCSRTLRLPTMSSPTSDSSSLGTVKKHRALYVQHFSLPTDWVGFILLLSFNIYKFVKNSFKEKMKNSVYLFIFIFFLRLKFKSNWLLTFFFF
ncbi:hypothetical protein HMI56_003460 [Coelomomyces lativittatus]|nr:hypothetical protein HMI56_003460 [Coelomomyces lativittatus]